VAPLVLVALWGGRGALAQTPAVPQMAAPATATEPLPSPTATPPWPKVISTGDTTLTIYEPQAEKWDGKQLVATSVVAVRGAPSETPSYGVVHLTARTTVDEEQGLVSLHDVHISSAEFPADPTRGGEYRKTIADADELTSVVALGRLQAGIEAAQASRDPRRETVRNDPPRLIFSQRPAVLVLVDGQPVVRRIEGTAMSRVINTRALILRDATTYYLYVANRWVMASAIEGPWSDLWTATDELDRARDSIARDGLIASGEVDLLNASAAITEPATVYVSTTPAEVVETSGPPEVGPLGGTDLWYVTNTTSDVFVQERGGTERYYVLLSGRWFEARSLDGPWRFVAADNLPADFARISKWGPKANVLASIPGTTEAKEALIANQIPQTASVPRQDGPTLDVQYDGAPRFAPIESTSLQYATNTATPVIEIDPQTFYALSDGVWITASAPTGPWAVATTVPPVIYTIPTNSPLHYVTNVYVDGVSPGYVYEASTPGYLGTVVAPSGVVVYGTGYTYPPWIGSVWYAAPVTFGCGVGLALGLGFGFGFHSAFAESWWGPRVAFPVYARAPHVAHINVYDRWRGAGVVARTTYGSPRGIGGGPPSFYRVPPGGALPGAVHREVTPGISPLPRGPYPIAPRAPVYPRTSSVPRSSYRFAPVAPRAGRVEPVPRVIAPGYRPAAPGYALPVPMYRAPAPMYRAPVSPAPAYRAPAPMYRAPVSPTPAYRAPAPAFHAPAPGYPRGPGGARPSTQGGGGRFGAPGHR
jgi:hypothetical protein